jgi:hypothetical protein
MQQQEVRQLVASWGHRARRRTAQRTEDGWLPAREPLRTCPAAMRMLVRSCAVTLMSRSTGGEGPSGRPGERRHARLLARLSPLTNSSLRGVFFLCSQFCNVTENELPYFFSILLLSSSRALIFSYFCKLNFCFALIYFYFYFCSSFSFFVLFSSGLFFSFFSLFVLSFVNRLMFPGLLYYSSQIKQRRSLLKLLVFLLFFLIGFTITLCHLLFFFWIYYHSLSSSFFFVLR